MSRHFHRLGITLVLALLVLPAGALFAGDAAKEEAEVTLTGQLSQDDEGGYVLIERESGERISLFGPGEVGEQLGDHLGSRVTVTGDWAEDDDGNQYFIVTSVTRTA